MYRLLVRCRAWCADHPRVTAAASVCVIFVLLWLTCWSQLDPDFGWHLQAGNYIRAHGIPAFDPYTYTAGSFRWIDHEWGNDVLTSLLYRLGGYSLLSTAFAGLWTAALCLFRRRQRLVVLLFALFAVASYVGVRPAVWTALGVVLLLELLARRTPRALLLVPLLFLLWANLHGGFILGLAVVAYSAVRRRDWRLWAALLASLLATVVNPYGLRLYVEIFRTLGDSTLHGQIMEWRSWYIQLPAWGFIILWGVGFWWFDRRRLWGWLGLAPLLLVAALSANRNLPLFVMAALRDVDGYWDRLAAALPRRLEGARKVLAAGAGVAVAGVVAGMLYHLYWPIRQREASYPRAAVTYLAAHPCTGNIFNGYNYGGYLIWKLPDVPVYIDGRMPSWRDGQGQTYYSRYLHIVMDQQAQREEFARYHIRCAVLSRNTEGILVVRLQRAGWKTVVTDPNGSMLLLAP